MLLMLWVVVFGFTVGEAAGDIDVLGNVHADDWFLLSGVRKSVFFHLNRSDQFKDPGFSTVQPNSSDCGGLQIALPQIDSRRMS